MKIFLSWSGESSRRIAEILKVWLPDVISFFDPWISSEDIEKGARWEADLGLQLESTHIGIICITRENICAPWILFESGALAKGLGRAKVCTYLFGLQPSDLTGPLVQFQATLATQADTLKLLRTLNKELGENARSPQQLERLFNQWWPSLEKSLAAIPATTLIQKSLRSERDILEELLDLARQQVKYDSQGPNHPIDFLRISSFLESIDLRRFAEDAALTGDPEDQNAREWAVPKHQRNDLESLNGTWSSRWNQEASGKSWQQGTATIATHKQYFFLLHTDPRFEYLMLGKKNDRGQLIGRHFNISDLRDTSPWVGVIVSESRIDGRWRGGRWDLRRV